MVGDAWPGAMYDGACMAGGVAGGMHGKGHAWQGVCMTGVCGRGHVW